MQYCEPIYFLFFLPLVMLIYHFTSQKHRWKVLLFSSYIFFFSISHYLLIYLLLSTLSIHHIGLWLSSLQNERDLRLKEVERKQRKEIKKAYQKKQKSILTSAIILHVGLLVILKYSGFLGGNINTLFSICHIPFQIPVYSFFIPIGISFYTLQAVSYMTDVYRGAIKADQNLGRLALFISFFPQIMEGPICRYSQTAMSLYEGRPFHYQDVKFGIQRIAFGLMKKLIIADRLNILIKLIFNNYMKYDGGLIAFGAICYTCQLYMEFSGTIDVVIGSAEIFGVHMPENFRQPFFSKSISEFWTRWHITLGTWFKDYIYYPMSLSHPLRRLTTFGRKHFGNYYGPLLAGTISLLCVWFCNGIWHGAAWSYIFFGLYHFSFILFGNLFQPIIQKSPIHREHWLYKGFQMIRTSIIVCIGELFFRANSLGDGLAMFQKMINDFTLDSFANGNILQLGLDKHDFFIIGIVLLLIFLISVMKEKGVHIREYISQRHIVVRWSIYYAVIFMIVIFGAYGVGYIPVDPIYAGF